MPLLRRTLGRSIQHKNDMLKTMVTQLIQHERIETTLSRAKELRKLADRVVTFAKQGTPQALEKARQLVKTERELHKLVTVLATRYRQREGGYCRILQTGVRKRDAKTDTKTDTAQMALIEYVDRLGEVRPARPSTTSLLPQSVQIIEFLTQQ